MTESEVAVAGNSKFASWGLMLSHLTNCVLICSAIRGRLCRPRGARCCPAGKTPAVAEHLREAEGWEWCAGRMELSVSAVRMPEHTAVCRSRKRADGGRRRTPERTDDALRRAENQCEESDLLEAEMKLMRCMRRSGRGRRRCVPEVAWWCPGLWKRMCPAWCAVAQ